MRATPDLVATLVGQLTPAPVAWVARRLAIGFAAGLAAAAALVLALWGPRPDLTAALGTWPFWIKFAYTGLLAAAALAAVARLARPGGHARLALPVVLTLVALMGVIALAQLAEAPAGARHGLVMGATSATCPWLIMSLAIPILAGGIWAVRRMAPTRLRLTGAAIGLAAGALSAFAYAASCDEGGMAFVLLWYGVGMAVPAAVGTILGRRLLRW